MEYRSFSNSVIGPKYKTKGWKCQDSSGVLDVNDIKIIGVADGHGGRDYFRSEIGSKLAIETLCELATEFSKIDEEKVVGVLRFSNSGVENFKHQIVSEWKKRVKEHWTDIIKTNNKIGENEIRYRDVSEKYKLRYESNDNNIIEKYLFTAYGTTLLAAIFIGTQLLLLQIGDGSCVVLQKNGEFKMPMPEDSNNFHRVTASLCEENAVRKIRHTILDVSDDYGNSPIAVFLATDGVDDCFPIKNNEEHLYKLYSVVIDNIIKFGYEATEKEIKSELLEQLTEKGSRDDISMSYMISNNINDLIAAYYNIKDVYKPNEMVSLNDEIKEN